MNKEDFKLELKKIGINLTEQQQEQFNIYYKFLTSYNEHINVTSIINEKDVYLKHFYDSALLSISQDFNTISNMLDIGCGAGFPGLVIGILFPNIKITLLDSNNKKTEFCKQLIDLLKLTNVKVINERAEEYIKNNREKYDIVTARAVKNMPVLSELSIPYVKLKGYFIAMKSNYDEELKNSINAIKILGGTLDNIINKNLPNNSGTRNFIIIKKTSITNLKYPRKYNIILKKPL